MLTLSLHTLNPLLFGTPYDVLADCVPISLVVSLPQPIFARPNAPSDSQAAMVEPARPNPGWPGYATAGSGSPSHLAGGWLRQRTGTFFVHVPYRGGQPEPGILPSSAAAAHAKAGHMRPLAVNTRERGAAFPDVPTVAEALNLPDFEVDSWMAAFAPRGTPVALDALVGKKLKQWAPIAAAAQTRPDGGLAYHAGSWNPAATVNPGALAMRVALLLALWVALVPGVRAEAAPTPVTGQVQRALDPTGAVPGHIEVAYTLYPRRLADRPLEGTIVAVEGGPGYPSRGSRASYLQLFGPLMDTRQLLLVDNRGTGRSGPLRCPQLQRDPFYSPASVAACGAQLGERAALYGTGLAADDLAAVLDALSIVAPVDLYGDSYGTFFAQAFAGRHPDRVRSLTLDGAYAVTGADPWYPEAAPQSRAAFDLACRRSPACAALDGPSMDRIATLLDSLRRSPVLGTAADGDGNLQPVTADARGLAYVMFSNASGPVVYRELDAAARAWSEGDTAPLLRLVAENQTAAVSARAGSGPRSFSAGLFAAVSCADYPQVYAMTDPPARRAVQAAAAVAAKQRSDPNLYAPFRIDEFLSLPQDYSVIGLCVPWPVPSPAWPPAQPVPPGARFTSAPVLVLSGEFDSLTPPAQGAQAAALFPDARQVVVRNSFHVTALGDLDGCASTLVRRFVQTLSAGDTGCADAVPAWRLLPRFARAAAELPPATPGPGNEGTVADLQVAAAALLAAGDALARWWVNHDGSGVGLRGGRFTWQGGSPTRFTLDALRWTADVPVSGRVEWQAEGTGVRAELGVPGGRLVARWPDRAADAVASVEGLIDGRRIVARMPAP